MKRECKKLSSPTINKLSNYSVTDMIIKSFTHIIDKGILQKLILTKIKDSSNLGMVVVAVIILLRCVI